MENELICTPVMLPINVEADGSIFVNAQGIIRKIAYSLDTGRYQHLYLTSSREIKEGESYYDKERGVIDRAFYTFKSGLIRRKVEATTDKSLGLPLIPQSFIEEYVQKQGNIDKVKIKMTWVYDYTSLDQQQAQELSYEEREAYKVYSPSLIKSTKNEVMILPIKDSWNREEIKAIHKAYINDDMSDVGLFDKWFDKKY